ncbi:MAG: hypothetical protein UU16_C0022G0007 [Candidatus Woesebacteria bacterium GW2011_GWA2_40_7]|uniref:Uncharacterized protein n=3 Tax=Candidatus Woeseibacteriota TaxID=1752722 RepID=A0A0G0UY39_9BACT|nr:MAG: hypothetical protein UT17_C0002G0223 [Candidatus Woesebacteria bacterium GW2011_GWB1_39_10]KKR73385.1 MAG: hypothetical protein UU16_C0022G0007 [Candidatus Woesebacteria bacterium GW2011_GWA2_40_7]KKR92426.1 MAG: hypothetical protein UU42_C0001G0030 [Candidatus Woesebacteria bacterium GW2011_GWA1_41_13b]
MNIERDSNIAIRIPEDVYEQKNSLPDIETREKIAKSLFVGFSYFLILNNIKIDWEESGYRAKRLSRIENKIKRRDSVVPGGDIYGVRFITEEEDRGALSRLIQSAYSLTPNVFPWGKPSIRDYRNPEVRASHIEKSNPHMSPIYSALHINFIFQRRDSKLLDIGEVQIMTHKELAVYKQTRDGYSNGQSLLSRDHTSANS